MIDQRREQQPQILCTVCGENCCARSRRILAHHVTGRGAEIWSRSGEERTFL